MHHPGDPEHEGPAACKLFTERAQTPFSLMLWAVITNHHTVVTASAATERD